MVSLVGTEAEAKHETGNGCNLERESLCKDRHVQGTFPAGIILEDVNECVDRLEVVEISHKACAYLLVLDVSKLLIQYVIG